MTRRRISGAPKIPQEKYIGMRSGRLLVVRAIPLGERKDSTKSVECLCDCGKLIEISPFSVTRERAKSCGCYHTEVRKWVCETLTKHGHAKKGDRSASYRQWMTIINSMNQLKKNPTSRCNKDVGSWREFENFLADMGEIQPSQKVKRVDKSLPWSKENCVIKEKPQAKRGRKSARKYKLLESNDHAHHA